MNRKNRGHWTGNERTPTSAWERALRPHGSSLWLFVMLLIAAGVFLALAFWSALQDARQGPPSPPATQASVVSAPQESVKTEPVDPAMRTGPQPRTQQISKCTSRAGSATYSDGPCPPGTFTSVMTVRPDTNIVDGMTREAREASIGSNTAVAQRERQVASNSQGNGKEIGGSLTAECGRLSTSIAAIDAAARQPRSADEQDRLKAERVRLQDRHFALRCA